MQMYMALVTSDRRMRRHQHTQACSRKEWVSHCFGCYMTVQLMTGLCGVVAQTDIRVSFENKLQSFHMVSSEILGNSATSAIHSGHPYKALEGVL